MVVLDASAILAAILGEAGGDSVFDKLEDATVSTVNVAEVYTYAAINELPTDAIDAFFADTGPEIAPFDHKQAITTGRSRALRGRQVCRLAIAPASPCQKCGAQKC